MKHLLQQKQSRRPALIMIFALVGVCAILVVAYVLLSMSNSTPTSPELPIPPGLDDRHIDIDFNNREDVVAFFSDVGGEEVYFTLEQGYWVIKGYEDIPIDQSIPISMLNSVEVVQVSALLSEHVADLSPFGFDEPRYTIRLYFYDGSVVTYRFGEYVPHQQIYYFNIEGSNRLYIVTTDLAWKILEFWYVIV